MSDIEQGGAPTPQAIVAKVSRPGKGGICLPIHGQIKPGEVRNTKGSRPAGATIRDWINVMQTWPTHRVQAVLKSSKASVAKKTAARRWFRAQAGGKNAAGNPVGGDDADRIMDRTIGRPTQEIEFSGDVSEQIKDAMVMLSQDQLDAIRRIISPVTQPTVLIEQRSG